MIKIFFKTFLLLILLPNVLYAKSENFIKGIELFNKDKFEEAKFKFEQDIVFNPKSELSYLYLSKIFNKQKKKKIRRTEFENCDALKPSVASAATPAC